MSILPQLEQHLETAATRSLAQLDNAPAPSHSRPSMHMRVRTLRLPLIAVGCLLATATIALAASGVILTGAAVHPEEFMNPATGEGLPSPGASTLLSLRVPDPEGGLPWGMRIVRTTRGEVCLQVARIQGSQLGELGIDGAFHDDGRFHPLPLDALPADVFHGHAEDFPGFNANANTSCHPTGEAFAGERIGLDRNAAASAGGHVMPLRHLRDVSYGMLGSSAVSVGYGTRAGHRTVAVVPDIGVYLLVRPTHRHQQAGTSYGALGIEGDLPPSAPLTTITYRFAGKLCERRPAAPTGGAAPLANPCPWPHYTHASPAPARDLHLPLRILAATRHHSLHGVTVDFTAPFPITTAKQYYLFRITSLHCDNGLPGEHPGMRAGAIAYLNTNVKRGATVTHWLSDPELFDGQCGLPPHLHNISTHAATVEVLFHEREGESVIVGSTTVRKPLR